MGGVAGLERLVFGTIRRYRLLEDGDVVYVAVSGGKDSAAALWTLRRFLEVYPMDVRITAFHIDLGFSTSGETLSVVEALASRADVDLEVVHVGDFGVDVERAAAALRRPVCSVCGAVKRYLMNRVPRERGATKVATGHHMDDVLVNFIKNLAGNHLDWTSKMGPKLVGTGKLLTKIRPLYEASSDEISGYVRAMGLPVAKCPCPYTMGSCSYAKETLEMARALSVRPGSVRTGHISTYLAIRSGLDKMEEGTPGIKRRLVRGIHELARRMGTPSSRPPAQCSVCGEPSSGQICAFCRIRMASQRGIGKATEKI